METQYANAYIDGLIQKKPNSIANTLKVRLFCDEPSYLLEKTIRFQHKFTL